jgi:hypothetical protein
MVKPAGSLLVWISFVESAPRYNPYGADVMKVDDYHLFHFDRAGFEAAVAPRFEIRELFSCDAPHNSHFISLSPR